MIFALLLAIQLLQAGGAVQHEHLVAGVRHREAFGVGVDGLEGVSGRVGVVAAADEGAREVAGQLGQHVGVGVGQVAHHQAMAAVHGDFAGVGREARLAQGGEECLVHLAAEEAAEQLIGGAAPFQDVDEGGFLGSHGILL